MQPVTPDYLCMPSTACLIASKLGLPPVQAFDVSAACTGFVYATSVAKAFIESGMKKKCSYCWSRKVHFNFRLYR